MRILCSAGSLLVVAGLALLLWNAASGTDRVEVVRGGVSVSGTPGPDPSPGTVRRAGDPSSAPVVRRAGKSRATRGCGTVPEAPEEGVRRFWFSRNLLVESSSLPR